MKIELLACLGCWRIIDNFAYPPLCTVCGSKRTKAVGPSKFNILRWFLSAPKHVMKLILQDIREKCHE